MIKTGISGLRGTVAEGETSLTAATIARWVQAYVGEVQAQRELPRPRIALGHDARLSSPAVADIARGALRLAGAEVIDLGLTLTPTTQHYIRHAALAGGLMITASHNPIIYNGLKFLDHRGFFLPLDWWHRMESRMAEDALPSVGLDAIGSMEEQGEAAWQAHLAAAIKAVDLNDIRARRLRVALDACNGGAIRWVEFLEACGCEVLLLHSEPHGYFSREAEPLPQHLASLQHLVRQARCDIGFAADPDGDRLVLIDANGNTVSEEHTVVLVAMSLFGKLTKRKLVVNVVTTHALEDVIVAPVIRTPVGEMNVMEGVLKHGALLGGEGSGGIIVPHINLARDGLAAIAMILRLIVQEQRPLDVLVKRIPYWKSIKSKVTATTSVDPLRTLFTLWIEEPPTVRMTDELLEVGSNAGVLRLARTTESVYLRAETRRGDTFTAEGSAADLEPLFTTLARATPTLDLTDGVKVASKFAWLSLRPSNTEPIVRIMGEIKE